LHDTLLQGFLAVSMQLRSAVDDLPAGSDAKERFRTAMQALDRALEEGRCAVQGLRSSHQHFSSLGQALAHVPVDLGIPTGVPEFQVVVEGRQRELTAGLRDELYRISRE